MKKKRILSFLLAFTMVFGCTGMTTLAKTKVKKVSSSTMKKSKMLTFNQAIDTKALPSLGHFGYKTHCIQNFAFTPDSKYVLTSQEVDKGTTRHVFLSRFTMDGKFVDYLKLDGYGHGEAISVTQKDANTYYVWVSSGATKSNKYGTTITRLTYQVNEAGKSQILNRITIKDFSKAKVNTKKGKKKAVSFGYKLERMGVATDDPGNRICFRVCFKAGQGCNFVFYDLSKLSTALDEAQASGKTTYSIKSAKNIQVADIRSSLRPPSTQKGGFQSFDIDKNYLYIAGSTRNGKGTYASGIFKIKYKAGSTKVQVKQKASYVNTYIKIATKEIEGLEIKKSGSKITYFFNIYSPSPIRETQSIYRITR